VIVQIQKILVYLSALLMTGHDLVPHDHSGVHPPKFILWELLSVDLGSDHLKHFAASSGSTDHEDAHQQQLPVITALKVVNHWPSAISSPCPGPSRVLNRANGHLASWSRRPPPSKIA
jgi:hypothetical protein